MQTSRLLSTASLICNSESGPEWFGRDHTRCGAEHTDDNLLIAVPDRYLRRVQLSPKEQTVAETKIEWTEATWNPLAGRLSPAGAGPGFLSLEPPAMPAGLQPIRDADAPDVGVNADRNACEILYDPHDIGGQADPTMLLNFCRKV